MWLESHAGRGQGEQILMEQDLSWHLPYGNRIITQDNLPHGFSPWSSTMQKTERPSPPSFSTFCQRSFRVGNPQPCLVRRVVEDNSIKIKIPWPHAKNILNQNLHETSLGSWVINRFPRCYDHLVLFVAQWFKMRFTDQQYQEYL